jgi:hypothetical protein
VRVGNFLSDGDRVKFSGTAVPSPLVAGTWYYVRDRNPSQFKLAATAGGAVIDLTTDGTAPKVSSEFGAEGFNVKSSYTSEHWAFSDPDDWGDALNAYYQIESGQEGLKNETLKPWIQFDFGTARALKLWRISSRDNVQPEERVRLIEFFSSTDNSTWKFESYFEMPNEGGRLFDVLIPKAQSARYWRICVRSRWGEALYYSLLSEVQAYEGGRHWWIGGQITFKSDTTTAALRGVTRSVLGSYAGEIAVVELPEAPVAGDTFTIERGCPGTFNACCARLNTENYGGFNDLPTQTVIR